MISNDRLRELLEYDPYTGLFTWKARPSKRVHVGDVAGHTTTKGYVSIRVDRRLYMAHVLAWFYMTGEWPTIDVDHKNRKRDDNRWCNLRLLTRQGNIQNSLDTRSSSGYRGVYPTPSGQFKAAITAGYTQTHLGTFPSAEAASEAYAAARLILHDSLHY